MTELSIIIVNYNGEKFLEDCIYSVQDKCKSIPHEIILVDNNSSDRSLELLETKFKNIKLVKNQKNSGFAGGNNIGFQHCNGEYILLLNNDTILLDDLSPAIELIKNDKKIGIVGIKMLDGDNTFIPSFGKFPQYFNFLKLKTLQVDLDNIQKDLSQNRSFDVDWISGAFLLTTKDIWTQVDGLDEDYFMYVEDVDFNKKVQRLGKKRVYIPSISFKHFIGFNKKREKQLINSYKIYIHTHKKGMDKLLSLFMLNINFVFKKIFNRL